MQSRYYNPEWGRFINADGIVGKPGELLSCNMFAYCSNNPVNLSDPSGKFAFLAVLVPVIAVVAVAAVIVGTSIFAYEGVVKLLVHDIANLIDNYRGITYADNSSPNNDKEVTDAGAPNSKTWKEAKKKIKEGKGKGINVKARNEAEAEQLINEARPKLEKRPTYEANPPKSGYEVHPIDNDYGMPHIKWRDWSNGKSTGADGHIFWDN